MGKTAAECAKECLAIVDAHAGSIEEMEAAFERVFEQACAKPRRKISQVVNTGDVVMVFPTNGTPDTWALTSDLVKLWQTAFPSVDVKAECQKAAAWVVSNPERKKTARGMAKFLYGWMARTNDRPAAPPRHEQGDVKAAAWNNYQRAIKAGVKG